MDFFSPGKLLLTSEYTVLDGALALAVPTKWGQELCVIETEDGNSMVFWNAFHQEKLWLSAKIDYKNWQVVETNNVEAAQFVVKVLQNTQNLSNVKLQVNSSYQIKTQLQFPSNFGLGSSSTLMTNLAAWAEIDAFQLNDLCLGGSGYDIAVAKENSALLFQKLKQERKVQRIDFQPEFTKDLIFIHLNQKQDSREGIEMYRSKKKSDSLITEFSNLTKQVVECQNLVKFSELMETHETLLSNFLEIETVKEKYFKDAPVFIKSLGAWGGDFVMSSKFLGFQDYFLGKGFSTIFDWNDLIR